MSGKDFEKVDITIKSKNKDLYNFMNLVPERNKRIEKAPAESIKEDPMNDLAEKLHPKRQHMVIDDITDNTKSTKTFKLVPDPESTTESLAYFRAGQYLSLKVMVNGELITRPYSISSSPQKALEGYYTITIKKEEDDGFLTPYIWDNWEIGTKVVSSGPEGFFYYEPLRDKHHIVGLAGGSGITPFMSMAKSIINDEMDATLTILYGCSDEEDIIFYDELKELEQNHSEKIELVIVLSCEEVTMKRCETGFITAELIEKYANVSNSSFFVCGPQVMYDFVEEQLRILDTPPKQIRREAFGEIKNIEDYPGFPKDLAGESFTLKVHIGNIVKEIPAKATESVLVAMERAKLSPPSKCRSGECGFCRSLLLKGDVFVSLVSDWRREADKKFGYFHPCSSYPISNLELKVPRDIQLD